MSGAGSEIFGDRLASDGTLVADNFDRWFGDSRVVEGPDDGGWMPLVVYHGTTARFTAFDAARQGRTAGVAGGFFFTSSHEVARDVYAWREGGHVMQFYLRMECPLRWEEYFGLTGKDIEEETNGGCDAPVNYFDNNSDEIVAFAKANGFDGIMWPADPDSRIEHDLIVVFDPRQIKSAEHNSGLFDPESPDFTDGAATQAQQSAPPRERARG